MGTIPASENEYPEILLTEGAAPAAPGTNLVKVYAKADGLPYTKDDAGAESPMTPNAHIADTADAHDASAISFDPTGLGVIAATEVQTALEEVDAAIGAGGIPVTIIDAKGDLIAGTAADTAARLAVGTNGQIIRAASGQTTGLQWGDFFPAVATYTPAWTSDGSAPSIGNGTLSGRWRLLHSDLMRVQIRFVYGSTSTAGTGNYSLSLPSGYKTLNTGGLAQVAPARLLDTGTAHFSASALYQPNATTCNIIIADATGVRLWGAGVPITLATGDELNITALLEVETV